MEFKVDKYAGVGVNHLNEEFLGIFQVQRLSYTDAFLFDYLVRRKSDNTRVHQEFALIGENDEGQPVVTLHMEEMPCQTQHILRQSGDNEFVYEYGGGIQTPNFFSRLLFRFEQDAFIYEHQWRIEHGPMLKSWCHLKPQV